MLIDAAGLYCGILLAQAGHSVRIYEASNRVGGRIFTYRDSRNPSIYVGELGAMRFPLDSHSYLNHLIRERYKLNTTVFVGSNDNTFAYINGIFGTIKELRENPAIFGFNITSNEQGKVRFLNSLTMLYFKCVVEFSNIMVKCFSTYFTNIETRWMVSSYKTMGFVFN